MSYASLCVLSYNRPDMLARCLASIHETADMPFELIVHDDGSTDRRVYDILSGYAPAISTVITNRPGNNQGVGLAVERMFELASGDYLFKIDQDCTFEHGWLSEMCGLLDYGEVGTVGGFRYWLDPVDHRKMLVRETTEYDVVEDYVSSVFGVSGLTWDAYGWKWTTHSEAFAEDVMFKRYLTEERGLIHVLTKPDVVHNDGFGVGPSTVVPEHGKTHPIHRYPYLFGPDADEAARTPRVEVTC